MEEAVYSDCRKLIKNFFEKGCPSFKSFCTEWKNLSFQHIFTNQPTYIQVQQTVACAFHFGKCIMGNRSVTRDNVYNFADCSNEQTKLLQRIGGLYVLYAIYFKQPLDQYTKIEVSLGLWREMKHFIKHALPTDKPEYDEARYVFWKLFTSQAFRFTALDYCVGLEGLVDYYDLDNTKSLSLSLGTESAGRLIEKHTNFNKLQQATPALETLEKGYNEMKNELTKLHKLDRELLPPTNIFQNLRKSFEKIKMIIDEADELDESAGPSGSKRRKLKDAAFHAKVASKNITSQSETEPEKMERQPRKYVCRMSARTIFAQKLPDEMSDESSGDADSNTSPTKSCDAEKCLSTKEKTHKKAEQNAEIAKNTTTESDTD